MIYGMVNKVVKEKKKGQFANLTWNKQLKTRAGVDVRVEKVSSAVVRFGVEYEKIKAVQEKKENGEIPKETQPLKWGQWSDFPYFISHKDNMYLRCSTVKNSKVKTEYFADGQPITREEAEVLCLKSEFGKSGAEMDVFTVNTENILSIK